MRKQKGVVLKLAALALLALAGSAIAQTMQGELTDGASKKTHTMQMEAGKVYEINMVSKAFDTFLHVQDSTGKELGKNDDGGEELNSRLVFAPPATGDYKVIASSFGGKNRGAYTLTTRTLPEIKPGQNVTGKIDDKTLKPFDIKCEFYVIQLTAGVTYKIDFKSKEFDPILDVKKAGAEKEEAQDDDGGDGLDSRLIYTAKTTGYYELLCGSLDGKNGQFTLSVEVTAKQD